MNFSRVFFLSLLPGRQYQTLMNLPPPFAFRYFLALSALVGLVHWVLIINPLRTNIRLFFSEIARQVPEFEIRQGRAIAPFSPKTFALPFDAELMIDTTNKTRLPPSGTPVAFLLTERNLVIRAGGQVLAFGLPLETVAVNADYWNRLADIWAVRASALSLAWLLIKTILAKFVQVVLLSGLAMFWDAVWKLNWDYRQMLNLCFYSLTPTSLLGLLLGLASEQIPSAFARMAIYYGFFAVFITLTMGMLRRS
ncbi:MAG: DUF1189 domain-containing protein [Armatimonadetes bacterium]|nr:DUF1189 domain-containing protein [Armatimonadota bacterium]MDW8121242.1 DUF1189 family protein [Armatimonadota bacterium]